MMQVRAREQEKRKEILAALLFSDENNMALLEHVSSDEKQDLLAWKVKLAGKSTNDILQRHRTKEQVKSLHEIHPAWILEHLEKETPRVIGLLLRYLPSRHVRYVIEHLSPRIREELPDMLDAFSVPSDLLKMIRKKFEAKFDSFHLPEESEAFTDLGDLCRLSSAELELLFQDIGMIEMAMALSTMSAKAHRVLLHRFPLRLAKRLQNMMKSQGFSAGLGHEARLSVLEAARDKVGSEQLFIDIGLTALGRALHGISSEARENFFLKLSPKQVYILKRAMMQFSEKDADLLSERRKIIFERILVLSQEEQIEGKWQKLFSSPSHSEEIQELQELA